jgi:hypothetical protein
MRGNCRVHSLRTLFFSMPRTWLLFLSCLVCWNQDDACHWLSITLLLRSQLQVPGPPSPIEEIFSIYNLCLIISHPEKSLMMGITLPCSILLGDAGHNTWTKKIVKYFSSKYQKHKLRRTVLWQNACHYCIH